MTRVLGPFVIVHNIAHVRAAVGVSKDLGRPVTLISPPGAVASMGPGVFMQMIDAGIGDAARGGHGDCIAAVFDCAGDPGQAMAALQAGCRHIRIDAGADVRRKLGEIAGDGGLILDGAPLEALDLANGDSAEEALSSWLATQTETTR